MVTVCGCYYESGPAMSQVTKSLPRSVVEAHTTILAMAYSTQLTQVFVNPSETDAIAECRYVFPLYDGVSVTDFECVVGSRVIRGVVKEKTEAKEVYSAAVASGQTAGLLEQGPTTDVFATTLGNIPAGSTIRVVLKYAGELKHDLNANSIRYTLPTYISPRYGASQGTEVVLSGEIKITVDINMPSDCLIEGVKSPSHPVSLMLGRISAKVDDSPVPSRASASLALGSSALDQDFVLEILSRDSGRPQAILEKHPTLNGQRALMATLVPVPRDIPQLKPELIIVADQSGSMGGGRTTTLVKALNTLLRSLPEGIKFNICAYGSGYTFLWDRSHVYDRKSLDSALGFVEKFNGHHGGTETLRALQASIKSRDVNEALCIIVATDGDIWQQEELFAFLSGEVRNSKKPLRVFPLGIGNSVSSGFIEGVARAGNGFAQSVGEGEPADEKIIRMLSGALTPDSSNYIMEVHYGENDGDDDEEYEIIDRVADSLEVLTFDEAESRADQAQAGLKASCSNAIRPKLLQTPQVIPPLYASIRSSVYLLLSPEASGAIPKNVVMRKNNAEDPFEITIPVETLHEPGTLIHSLAAKRAIVELEDGRGWLNHAHDSQGVPLKDVNSPERFEELIKNEAVRLGVQFQLTGKYTSSVAVEANTDPDAMDDNEDGQAATPREITIAPGPSPAAHPQPQSQRTKQCARLSTGGMAPRKQLASMAARKCAPPPPPSAGKAPAPASRSARTKSTRGRLTGGGRGGIVRAGEDRSVSVDDYANMVMIKSEDNDKDNDPSSTTDSMLSNLLSLQSSNGSWTFNNAFLVAVGLPNFPQAPPRCDPTVWTTLIAIAVLETRYPARVAEWQVAVGKAWEFVRATVAGREGRRVEGWKGSAERAVAVAANISGGK